MEPELQTIIHQHAPVYSYRVPYLPRGGAVPACGLLPFHQVQAPDALSAMRAVAHTAPAEAVLEPERLGEVLS